MIPVKCAPEKDLPIDAPQRLSKSKRRRLRKKKLQQAPREDGGEGQAELPPEADLQLRPIVAAVVSSVDSLHITHPAVSLPEEYSNQTISGSFTITSISDSISAQETVITEQVKVANCCPLNKQNLINEQHKKKHKIKNINDNLVVESTINKNTEELLVKIENNTEETMADNQGKKQKSQKSSPAKNPNQKSPQTKTPKVPVNKSEEVKLQKPVTPQTVKDDIKSPVNNVQSTLGVETQGNTISLNTQTVKDTTPITATPSTTQAAEKTREEIMAERKAKKAEKAAKKGKIDKENTKPKASQEPKPMEKPGLKEVKEMVQSATCASKPEEMSAVKPIGGEKVLETNTPTQEKSEDKSKAALKEERRLKQEAQRAAKAAALAAKSQDTSAQPAAKKDTKKPDTAKDTISEKPDTKAKVKSSKAQTNLAKLLNHLQHNNLNKPLPQDIHPAIVKLGLQYAHHQIAGSNARAVALMRAMKQVVEDYETPPQSELRRDLESRMQSYMDYLDHCRPTSVSMANAMRDLKNKLQQIPSSISDKEAKKLLIAAIDGQGKEDGFINKLELDCLSVSINVLEKIKDDDVILTYGCSSLVQRVLIEAQSQNRRFRVVVVGARPWQEAEKMLHQLTANGLRCSYLLISAVSSVMKDVSKVLLGAHAILANGYVMARAGSSQVALIAHSFNVPVIVCCETYKFCDRVQTDAFAYNELGDPEELVPGLQIPNLTQCVLAYDVTPPELVSTVVTEVSMLPCSSVPVVLHMQSSETRLKRRSTSTAAGMAKA